MSCFEAAREMSCDGAPGRREAVDAHLAIAVQPSCAPAGLAVMWLTVLGVACDPAAFVTSFLGSALFTVQCLTASDLEVLIL
jgi:hypothetical protein